MSICNKRGWAVVFAVAMMLFSASCVRSQPGAPEAVKSASSAAKTATEKPAVYMTHDISPAGLMAVYKAIGRPAVGKNVAVKLSTGEPGGHNFLDPKLIAGLVHEVKGTIVECNTAYGGQRAKTEDHMQAAKDHGFCDIAKVDIMDAEGEMKLPVKGGVHLQEDVVGSHFGNYDFLVVLSHFKGHAMGGFGGALKNISIGVASAKGKGLIHTAGASEQAFGAKVEQDHFLESMAEAAQAVNAHMGDRVIYINVMNKMSVDCDCSSHPANPTMADIGILGSTDPVALDQACVDLVYAAKDSKDLIERMESRHGIHTVERAAELGVGSREYRLVEIDK